MTTKLAILTSGNQSLLHDLLDATRIKALDAEIAVVVADEAAAAGLSRLEKAGVPVQLCRPADDSLTPLLKPYKADFVVLADWPHALSDAFLQHFRYRLIDLYWGLPGQPDGVEEIVAAFQRGELRETGVTVYFVAEHEAIGPTILSEPVMMYKQDKPETLARRMEQAESRALVHALQRLTEGDEE